MSDFKKRITDPALILPSEPPCLNCKFWKPERIYGEIKGCIGQQFNGSRLCWANDQYPDFSCFTDKD